MKTKFLIAPFWRIIGLVLATFSLAFLLFFILLSIQNPELPSRDKLIQMFGFLFTSGMVLSIWAKFKREDELTRHLRFSSALQAIVASAVYFMITYSSIYGIQYWIISMANPVIPVLFYFLIFWGKYLYQHWRNTSSL